MKLRKQRKQSVAKTRIGKFFAGLFFIPFLLAGVAILYMGVFKPYWKAVQSLNTWEQVESTITKSVLESSRSSDGTTYKATVEFRYTYDGQEYTGGSFDFSGTYSNDRAKHQEILDRYPVGSQHLSYVNPANPEEAVLLGDGASFQVEIVIFGLIFALVGGIGFGVNLFLMFKPAGEKPLLTATGGVSRNSSNASGFQNTGAVTLCPVSRRMKDFFVLLGFAAFWNSIVSVFVIVMAKEFMRGEGEWFIALFLVPFVLIGIGLLVYSFYLLLRLFNPKAMLTLNKGAVEPGDIIEMEWRFTNKRKKIERLEMKLICREEVTYRHGKNTSTEKATAFEKTIFETSDRMEMWAGVLKLEVPIDAMPNFRTESTKVSWVIELSGQISMYPDIKDEYDFPLVPLSAESLGKRRFF